jgi:hypothetical protein
MKPVELIIIVSIVSAWSGILLLVINHWGKEICRRISVSRLV